MTERIVPVAAMDNVPVSGLPELQTHLQQLVNDPSLPFNLKLLDDVELQLTGKLSPSSIIKSYDISLRTSQSTDWR